jgi:hypothetical protein
VELNTAFLTPVLALVVWTLVMWIWMYATRIPAMQKAGVDPQDAMHPGSLAKLLPSATQRVADNYNHLHEAPTIFYALMFFAALTGGADGTALALGWTYVLLRVLHSLIQATFNKVALRFTVFAASSVVLMVFAGREVLRIL